MRLLRKLMKKQGIAPDVLVTDRLRASGATAREGGLTAEHVHGKRKNNRTESSHVPIRRRGPKIRGLGSPDLPDAFLPPTLPSPTHSPPAAT